MKQAFLFILIMQSISIVKAQQISNLNDERLPSDLRNKIAAMSTPEQVQNFNYNSSKIFVDSSLASVQQKIALSFSNGKLIGTITTITSNDGYEAKKDSYSIEICFSYCCIDENDKEDCTTNFDEFKKKKLSDKCKKTTSHPCD